MLRTLKKVKSIGWFLIILMLWVYGGGRVNAENYTAYVNRAIAIASPDNRFDALISEIKDVVKSAGTKAKAEPEKGFQDIAKLNKLKQSLVEEHEKVQDYFSQLESLIKEKKLSGEILNRQQKFSQEYQTKYEALMENLQRIESAHQEATGFWSKLTGKSKKVDWDGVLGKTLSFLEENAARPRKTQVDPKNLPHRSLKADKPIPPKLTREEWLKAFPKEAEAKPVSGQSSSTKTNGSNTLAATTPPISADLAETIEVQFTPEIRQLADSLGRNPVRIFNWVRNNIEFVPTWGSIQGAQLCLETRTGNAFDTASLLIALLRYSGIPARYQMGTIEVPIAKAMNWLGGFTDPRAAARFAASGGVPSAGTVEQGGVLRSIRMEHLWVKTFVDYVPSQGGVNNQNDTWVDLDPSFKLYRHTAGSDITGALAFDTTVFNNHLISTTTFNANEQSITNVDHAFIKSAFNTSITNLSNAFPGVAPRTLLPEHSVITSDSSVIPASFPYKVLVKGTATATLPSELRHHLTISIIDKIGESLLTYSTSLPELTTTNMSLFFTYATQADIDFVRSVVPQDVFDPNTPGKLQRFLDAIPSHLVGVRPVIQLNGIAAATGNRVGMGEAQTVTIHFTAPTVRTADVILDLVAWGRYGIALDYAGISESMIRERISEFRSLAQQYQASNGQGQSISPLMAAFYDLILSSWFFSVDQVSRLFSKSSKVCYTRYPSLGFTYPEFSVTSVFGVPNRLAATTFFLDIARQFQVVTALDGDNSRETGFNLATGFASSELEGSILARLLSGQSAPPPGMSAASAIRSASTQGIPLHAIDGVNIGTVLPKIADSFPKEAISNAVNAGRVVLVPQAPPVINGLPVNGYITVDPQSGDGAYMVGRAGAGLSRPCDPPLSTAAEILCVFTLGFFNVIEVIGSIVSVVAIVYLGMLVVVAAGEAFVAAVIAGTSLITTLALGVMLLAAVVAFIMMANNLRCYISCLTPSPGPMTGCATPSSILGCQDYLLRMELFAVGLDDLLDVWDLISQG